MDELACLGLVTTPTAKPPTAPARIPIKASTRALSTKVEFPPFAIEIFRHVRTSEVVEAQPVYLEVMRQDELSARH